jgi:hypothetical protein
MFHLRGRCSYSSAQIVPCAASMMRRAIFLDLSISNTVHLKSSPSCCTYPVPPIEGKPTSNLIHRRPLPTLYGVRRRQRRLEIYHVDFPPQCKAQQYSRRCPCLLSVPLLYYQYFKPHPGLCRTKIRYNNMNHDAPSPDHCA